MYVLSPSSIDTFDAIYPDALTIRSGEIDSSKYQLWWIHGPDEVKESVRSDPRFLVPTTSDVSGYRAAMVAAFWREMSAGVNVSGFTLGASQESQTRFTGLGATINLALVAGVPATTETQIWDAAGTVHTMTFADLIPILLGYSGAVAAKLATLYAIQAAATVEELDAISLT